MKMILMGTGSNGGIPQVDDFTTEGSREAIERGGRNRRTRAGISIQLDNGKYIIVDASPDFAQQLINYGISTKDIIAILISHAHHDHSLGLYELCVGRKLGIVVASTNRVLNVLKKTFGYLFDLGYATPKEIQAGEEFGIEGLRITPIEVRHTPLSLGETLGFKFDTGKKRVVLFPNINNFKSAQDIEKYLFDCDEIVIDGTFYQTERGHMSIRRVIDLLAKYKGKIRSDVYITHINHSEGTHDRLEERMKDYVRERFGESEVDRFHLAYDGLELEL